MSKSQQETLNFNENDFELAKGMVELLRSGQTPEPAKFSNGLTLISEELSMNFANGDGAENSNLASEIDELIFLDLIEGEISEILVLFSRKNLDETVDSKYIKVSLKQEQEDEHVAKNSRYKSINRALGGMFAVGRGLVDLAGIVTRRKGASKAQRALVNGVRRALTSSDR